MSNFQNLPSALTDKKMSSAKKELLFSELGSLLSSGLDFSSAFLLLISGEKNDKQRRMLKKIYDHIVAGGSLADALKRTGCFSELDTGVVRIGEETGRLNEAMDFLTDYCHKKVAQKRMVSSAVSYPCVILGTAVVVVIFMLSVIVPMFEQVYARMGGELPAMTRGIIALSQQFPKYAAIFLVVSLCAGGLLYLRRESDGVRSAASSLLLKLPVVGSILRKNYQAHFCKLLYLVTSSGIPLLYGIGMLRSIITFYPYNRSFMAITADIERGGMLTRTLVRFPDIYDKKLVALLSVGEETNRLPQMLLKQSDDLTRELEHSLKQLGTMLEPVLIVLIGGLVAVIMVSMYLPMFQMGNNF